MPNFFSIELRSLRSRRFCIPCSTHSISGGNDDERSGADVASGEAERNWLPTIRGLPNGARVQQIRPGIEKDIQGDASEGNSKNTSLRF